MVRFLSKKKEIVLRDIPILDIGIYYKSLFTLITSILM